MLALADSFEGLLRSCQLPAWRRWLAATDRASEGAANQAPGLGSNPIRFREAPMVSPSLASEVHGPHDNKPRAGGKET
jgi:hypothetical protein